MDINILSNLIITKVFSCTTMYAEKNNMISRKNRTSWAILIKYEGETKYISGGSTFISNINNIIVLPKGSSYKWQCVQPGHFSIIEFESDTTYDKIFTISIKKSDKFLELFKHLEYIRTLRKPTYGIESIRDTYSLLLMLLQTAQNKYLSNKKIEKISPALKYIAENYNKNIKNDDLASITGLSTVYFRKIFVDTFGISPIAYIHKLRIKKAKEMLRSDYGNITYIAESLGYLNVYDFSRAFKKHTGVPPSKY